MIFKRFLLEYGVNNQLKNHQIRKFLLVMGLSNWAVGHIITQMSQQKRVQEVTVNPVYSLRKVS